MRRGLKRHRWAALLLLVPFLVVGCDDGGSTGPEDADLAAMATAMDDAVAEFLVNNDALLAFGAVANAMAEACGGGGLFDMATGLTMTDLVDGRIPGFLMDARTPEPIDEACLGQSLILDPTTGEYGPGGSGSIGGNTVRFALYAVDSQGRLTSPLNAIGYVDIVDNSTDFTLTGSVTAVVDGMTMIQFTGTIAISLAGGISLDGEGYFSADGSRRMEMEVTGNYDLNTEVITANASLDTPEISADVVFQGNGSLDTETLSGDFDATIAHAGTTVRLDGDIAESGDVEGDILVNGSAVATFTIDMDTESFDITDTSDGALSQDDFNAIEAMFASAAEGLLTVASVGLVLILLIGL